MLTEEQECREQLQEVKEQLLEILRANPKIMICGDINGDVYIQQFTGIKTLTLQLED
tara:strand:+ start:15975 stop:16145 length:171 start_codon:yes stop_codon:yes gene_type:complete